MAEDYWERQFRVADERAALLAEATIPELIEIYHSSGEDLDMSSLCFGALQRRPPREVRRNGWQLLRADASERRRFGVQLLSIACRGERARRWLVPVFVGLFRDSDARVVEQALSAIEAATVDANGGEFGARVRANAGKHSPAWTRAPLPLVVGAEDLAFLLHHPESGVRDSLAETLRFCGTRDATAIILGLTWDTDLHVRAHAALMLDRPFTGAPTDDAIDRLWQMVEEPWRYVRACSITSLVELGEKAAESLVDAEIREAVAADESGICIWPLKKLVSERPELASAETHNLLRNRHRGE